MRLSLKTASYDFMDILFICHYIMDKLCIN